MEGKERKVGPRTKEGLMMDGKRERKESRKGAEGEEVSEKIDKGRKQIIGGM